MAQRMPSGQTKVKTGLTLYGGRGIGNSVEVMDYSCQPVQVTDLLIGTLKLKQEEQLNLKFKSSFWTQKRGGGHRADA